ncbi:Histidine kinase-like ATPase [Candidatus Nanopelagicus limnes]|uniref:Histidine kinase-like ATPase n=1 Tax=Candidatus Nanopelagicus limnae TaxID=1884634 RepID=A0A249JXB4_9ACTN|nr:ATP-binding protein [Candidatus Nanopelagicus limnes]ASY09167.1 Histidine kinase-like ATPase [Candidatus Nanopelagicus limnes]
MSVDKDTPEQVTIRPGIGLYALFPSLRYSPWVALGEMVDNSIQSYQEHKEELFALHGPEYKLRIEINYSSGDNPTIQLIDNAAGIYTKDIERAFTPAMPPADKKGISQYGIGMKSSACWYANFFTIRTRALGEPIIRTVTFDIPKIIKNEIYELDIEKEEATNPKVHGTRIILKNLNQPVPVAGAASRLRSYLRSMYRDFLRTGELVLLINNEVQEAPMTNWLLAPYWPTDMGPLDDKNYEWVKDFEIELNESHNPINPADPAPKIRGRIGILEKGDTKRAGLALLWRRKVVQGAGNMADSPDDLYRPGRIFGGANSFERQRVVGELDVSELSVTSFKDAVVWREGQEEEVLKKIKEALNTEPNPLLKMAKNYRASDNSKAGKAKLQGSLSDVVDSATRALIENNASEQLGDGFEITKTTEVPEPPRTDETNVVQKVIKLIPQFNSDIILEVKDQIADTSWLRVRQIPDLDKWVITINREHPFMKSFTVADPDSLDPVLRIALAIGIAEIQGLSSGFDTAGFLRLSINDLLRNYLSSRSDVIEMTDEENG